MLVDNKGIIDYLLVEFQQNWDHYRHIEDQRWRLFVYYLIVNPTLLSVIVAAFEIAKIVPPAPVLVAIGGLSFGWSALVLWTFVKWRLEFLLHLNGINAVRDLIMDPSRMDLLGVQRSDIPVRAPPDRPVFFMKPASVFMVSNYVVILTATLMTGLAAFLYADGSKDPAVHTVPLTLAGLVSFFALMSLIGLLFVSALGTRLAEKRFKVLLFGLDRRPRGYLVLPVVLISGDIAWVASIMTLTFFGAIVPVVTGILLLFWSIKVALMDSYLLFFGFVWSDKLAEEGGNPS